jgi:predicted PurR-regulated permease PerM
LLVETVRPYVGSVATWLLSATGGFGMVLVHLLLTVIIAAILYANGEAAANGVLKFARRFGQEPGEQIVHLAGQAIRGVALGVIVTAIVQSLLAGLGLWVSGVPRFGLLTAVVFVLGVAQLGPILVLVPAVIWLYWSGNVGWAAALLVWTIIVGSLDNILRPILIRRGVDLPLILIITGVIGGLIGFGVVGLFIGPVILAVTYTLVQSWINDGNRGAA